MRGPDWHDRGTDDEFLDLDDRPGDPVVLETWLGAAPVLRTPAAACARRPRPCGVSLAAPHGLDNSGCSRGDIGA